MRELEKTAALGVGSLAVALADVRLSLALSLS
jgi:hypothetical protein